MSPKQQCTRWTWVAVAAADLALVVAAWLRYETPTAGRLAFEEQLAEQRHRAAPRVGEHAAQDDRNRGVDDREGGVHAQRNAFQAAEAAHDEGVVGRQVEAVLDREADDDLQCILFDVSMPWSAMASWSGLPGQIA